MFLENGKHKREGPCVGTKGFRAPEVKLHLLANNLVIHCVIVCSSHNYVKQVLFKSIHQGCKADVWSAGVTLLYLMIGKTPFGGDPEQWVLVINAICL